MRLESFKIGATSSLTQGAWQSFYNVDHIKTLMRRGATNRVSTGNIMGSSIAVYVYACVDGVQPLESGFIRRRVRRERRPGLPIEHPLVFYPKYLRRALVGYGKALAMLIPLSIERRRLKRDPQAKHYRDQALTPVDDQELASTADVLGHRCRRHGGGTA